MIAPLSRRTPPDVIEVQPRPTPAPAASDPLGLNAASLRALERDLQVQAPSAQALCRASDVLLLQGRRHDAMALLTRGLLLHPLRAVADDHMQILSRLSNVMMHLGRPRQATEVFPALGAPAGDEFPISLALAAASAASVDSGAGEEALAYVAATFADTLVRLAGTSGDTPAARDCIAAAQAICAYSQRRSDDATKFLADVVDPVYAFHVLLHAGRVNEAMRRMVHALDTGDAEALRRMWLSPLIREASGDWRFQEVLQRSNLVDLRRGDASFTVPGHLAYSGELGFEAFDNLAAERRTVSRVQALLDAPQPALSTGDLLFVHDHLLLRGDRADAEAVLRQAILKRHGPERVALEHRLVRDLLDWGRNDEAQALLLQLPEGPAKRVSIHLVLRAIIESPAQVDRQLADIELPLRFANAEDRGTLLAIRASLLHRAGKPAHEVDAVLAEIHDPWAKAMSLAWMNRGDEMDFMNLGLGPEEQRAAWTRLRTGGTAHTFRDHPQWDYICLRGGHSDVVNGDLHLWVPAALMGPRAAAAA